MGFSKKFQARHALDVRRRGVMVSCIATVVGLLAFPFLPKGSDLNPDDLLEPELAQANPALMRELCLEFYAHPKVVYRMAAVVAMGTFKGDVEIQQILAQRIANEPIPDVRHVAMDSLVEHRDPGTHATIARLYWADPALRTIVDDSSSLYELNALKTAIQSAKP